MSVIIPSPNTHNDVATSQHLIPRCYMKAWGYNAKKTSVWVYDKKKNFSQSKPNKSKWNIESKQTNKICAIDNFHDLKASSMYLPEEALIEIFSPLLSILNITLDKNILDTEEKLWKNYYQIDKWVITDKSNNNLSCDDLNKVKKYLNESRYTFVETEWSYKYENDWADFITQFEAKARHIGDNKSPNEITTHSISKGECEKLLRYSVIYNFRSIEGNEIFNNALESIPLYQELKNIVIPENELVHPNDKTAADEFKHAKRIKDFIDFLKDDSGTIKTVLNACSNNLYPSVLLSNNNNTFITSNEPSFVYRRKDDLCELIFVASPTMLISFTRGNDKNYHIKYTTKKDVNRYNKIIAQHSSLLILPTESYDIKKLLHQSPFTRLCPLKMSNAKQL